MNVSREPTPVTQNWQLATIPKEALSAVVMVAMREMVLKESAVVRHYLLHC